MDFLTYEEILGLTIGHCFSPLQPLVFNLKIKKKSIPVRLRCAWAVVRNLHPLGRVCVGPGQGPKRWVWGKAGSFGKDFFCCADVFFLVGKGGESLLTTCLFWRESLPSELAAIYPNFPWKWKINYSQFSRKDMFSTSNCGRKGVKIYIVCHSDPQFC